MLQSSAILLGFRKFVGRKRAEEKVSGTFLFKEMAGKGQEKVSGTFHLQTGQGKGSWHLL